jgi:hypothetical protein
MFAVVFGRTVETAPDGSQVVTESVKVTRKTYTQDWPRYNAATTHEGETIKTLLRGLCDGIAEPARSGAGRRPVSLGDSVFAMTTKVYSGVSSRRATTDMLRRLGIRRPRHGRTPPSCFESAARGVAMSASWQ